MRRAVFEKTAVVPGSSVAVDRIDDRRDDMLKRLTYVNVWVQGQDGALALMAVPGPPVFDDETRTALETLVAKGAAGGLFFSTEDVQKSYEELRKLGVEFSQEPTTQPYGIDAGFRDPSGNQM